LSDEKSIDELRSGLSALHLLYGNNRSSSIGAAIESFENEISRRAQQSVAEGLHQQQMEQGKKIHQESIAEQQKLHQTATEQGKNLHGETMGEMGKIKVSVDLIKTSVERLGRPRWIDWAILVAGAIAAVATVIELFRGH